MKKSISILLAAAMMLGFTACGEDESEGTVSYVTSTTAETTEAATEQPTEAESGEYDAGKLTVSVPSGWKVFPVYDHFANEAEKDTALKISKGAEKEEDLNYTPYIQFDFYSKDDEFKEPKIEWYGGGEGNVLAPVTTGRFTWQAFEVMIDVDLQLTVLYTEDEFGNHYVASVWPELIGGSFSLSDSDVIEILESVRPSN